MLLSLKKDLSIESVLALPFISQTMPKGFSFVCVFKNSKKSSCSLMFESDEITFLEKSP